MPNLLGLSFSIPPVIINGLPCLCKLDHIALPLFGIETSKKLRQCDQNTLFDSVNILQEMEKDGDQFCLSDFWAQNPCYLKQTKCQSLSYLGSVIYDKFLVNTLELWPLLFA